MDNLLFGKNSPTFIVGNKKSLAEILCEKLMEYPKDQICAIDAITKENITYHQILRNATAIRDIFKSLGAKHGDTVMLLTENSIYYQQFILASLLADIILCPVNPVYTTYELDHMCKIIQPKIVVTNLPALKKVEELQTKFRYNILEFSQCCHFQTMHKPGNLLNISNLKFTSRDDAPVLITCSSGTTGLSKGVVHTQCSFKAALEILKDEEMNANNSDIVMGILPFFHAMGTIALLANLFCGQKMIVMSRFKPQIFLSAIEEYGITKMFIVPALALFLAQYSEIDKYNLSSLKEIICAGAALSAATHNLVKKRTNINIRIGYGMSETGFITLIPNNFFNENRTNAKDDLRFGASGKLLPGFIAKIIDTEKQHSLPTFKTGELCVKSNCNFARYYNNVEETQNTIDGDGYVHTGDMAYYDDEGYIYVVDRLKDLMKHKGFQVSPVELECILLKHEQVKDVAVVGVPDEKCGELPKAFVVLQATKGDEFISVSEDELQTFVANLVSPYKQLTGGVVFVDEIPKNPAGKILRRKLKEMYINEIEI